MEEETKASLIDEFGPWRVDLVLVGGLRSPETVAGKVFGIGSFKSPLTSECLYRDRLPDFGFLRGGAGIESSGSKPAVQGTCTCAEGGVGLTAGGFLVRGAVLM